MAELVSDGAEPVPDDTDTTDWNASFGQIGGSMHSDLDDLGIMQAHSQYGHEGEAIGWEGWAGHDPETGESFVVFTNTCSDTEALFGALAVLDPEFQPLADQLDR